MKSVPPFDFSIPDEKTIIHDSTRSFVDASRAFLNESNRPDPNRASRHRVEARDVDVPSVARSFVRPVVSFTRERAHGWGGVCSSSIEG
jgi:hypothetical protein